MESHASEYAQSLGAPNLATLLANLRQQFDNASDKPTSIIKVRYATLADSLQRSPGDIARLVGRTEAVRGSLKVFTDELHQAISDWRSRASS